MRFLPLVLSLLLASLANAQQAVYAVTHIDLMPANTAAGVAFLKQFRMQTVKEPGCVRFEVLQQEGRPNHLTLVGVWKDQKAFDAHDSSAWTKKLREQMQPLIGSPWDERLHHIVQ